MLYVHLVLKQTNTQENDNLKNPVEIAIKKFEQHPSINLINKNITNNENFHFSPADHEKILKEIINFDIKKKKNGTFKNILTRRLKDVSDVCSLVLAISGMKRFSLNKNFPENLKLADATPIFKKKDKIFVEKYRSVSVLPTVSKIFERIMQKEITDYIEKFLSPFLCGFRKRFTTQYALLSLIERWRLCLDKQGFAGVLLMYLSKAFDTTNLELRIAKLHAYGFSIEALEVLLSYLQERWQRVKINTTFSSWTQLLQRVPQGSVLGPMLFNIYINDMFFALNEIEFVILQMTQLHTFVT